MSSLILGSCSRLSTKTAAALFVALGAAFISCEAETLSLAGNVDRAAGTALESGVAALQVAVLVEGKEPFVKAYGTANLEQSAPATGATVFRVGSVTKQFAAAAILRLAESGKLSIEDPLSKTFSDFPRAEEVTIRHLLSHTSGLHNYTDEKTGLSDCTWNGSASGDFVTTGALVMAQLR